MSLQLICDYVSDGDEDNDISAQMETQSSEYEIINQVVSDIVNSLLNKVDKQFTHHYRFDARYRNKESSDESESDCSKSDVWSLSDSDDYLETEFERKKIVNCVTKGELSLNDLPPIERLKINVEVKDLSQVGIVNSILSQLVIIQSFKNIPVLDLDTVLFSKDGSSLGQVFDVIGPVKQPNYVLRFNSQNEIENFKLEINSPVYYAENQQQPITKYVFVHDLQNQKGSDASWKHNNEPPPEEMDYSDDEVERVEKWKKKAKSRKK